MTRIPIRNIYFLLCYAWDRLEEAEIVGVSPDSYTHVVDLFGSVLARGVSHLLRRGLDRGYVATAAEVAGVRGSLAVSQTIQRNLLIHAKTWCEYDEFTHDVPHNQIIATTVTRLLRVSALAPSVSVDLRRVDLALGDVSRIRLTNSAFQRVQPQSSRAFYDFLLKLCWLIHRSVGIHEESGEARFRDFTRSDVAMRVVFENFVRNFLRIHEKRYTVRSQRIAWFQLVGEPAALKQLPHMQTDVVMSSEQGHIVIDTKFTPRWQQVYRGAARFRSAHLYQMFAYIKNLAAASDRPVRGVLLYPRTGTSFQHEFSISGHRISVQSIDLTAPWQDIQSSLLVIGDVV